jgi:hypothetical protein
MIFCQEILLCYNIIMNARLAVGLLALMFCQPISAQQPNPQQQKQQGKYSPAPSSVPIVQAAPVSQPTPSQKQDGSKSKPNHWFEWFWQPLIGNWPLVVIGVIAIWATLRTLGIIRRQTVATEMATSATQRSVEVLIQGQRAWITAEAHGIATDDLSSKDSSVRIDLTNKGLTPAFNCVLETWAELLPSTTSDFTQAAKYFKTSESCVLYPNQGPTTISISIDRTEAELKELKNLRLYACVRIRVTFRDAFKSDRWAEYGFFITKEGLGFLPKYNDAN